MTDSEHNEATTESQSSKKTKRKKKGPDTAAEIRNLLIATVVLGIAGAALYATEGRGRANNTAPVAKAAPKIDWKPGQTVDVELTLVATDKADLACAASAEVGGKHCEFESKTKPWSKGESKDDKIVLKPYNTTNKTPLLAAGLWSQPALANNLPQGRFSVKCKFAVEGTVTNPSVRWQQGKNWFDESFGWPTGTLSNCTLVKLLNSVVVGAIPVA